MSQRILMAGVACAVAWALLAGVSPAATITAPDFTIGVGTAGDLTALRGSDALLFAGLAGVVIGFPTAGNPTTVGGQAFGVGAEAGLTPVSQSLVTGSGTAADPYSVTTVYTAGTPDVRVTETATYVVGSGRLRIHRVVANSTSSEGPTYSFRESNWADVEPGGTDEGVGELQAGRRALSPGCSPARARTSASRRRRPGRTSSRAPSATSAAPRSNPTSPVSATRSLAR